MNWLGFRAKQAAWQSVLHLLVRLLSLPQQELLEHRREPRGKG